jgi:hypothetical protein
MASDSNFSQSAGQSQHMHLIQISLVSAGASDYLLLTQFLLVLRW